MALLIGTSGWQYRDWRDRLYPRELAQKCWLEHYAERFQTVESNSAFYRLPAHATFADWARRTPADFVFAVKMSRYLTHIKRLVDASEPVARFLEHAGGLGPKLGPVLLQLPPTLKADVELLDACLGRFPRGLRVAVEFRHPSWFATATRRTLEERSTALCLTDRGSRPTSPLWTTAEWSYLRLHEGAASPHPCYGSSALSTWAERLAERWPSGDVYVYFNNDASCCAARDARLFARATERAGLRPSRVPPQPVPVEN